MTPNISMSPAGFTANSIDEEASQQKNIAIPAKAGAHLYAPEAVERWIPAFAGMTNFRMPGRPCSPPR